ncbi:MAG: class I SAM-dependent methyltransferase [Myxococcota bacterium]|nr:class I SAM-dependent methyltransferase [Myxococcota bacterium]
MFARLEHRVHSTAGATKRAREVDVIGSKERFSDRVADYVRYRPGYPQPLIDLLRVECGVGPGAFVADVGSGTGILTRSLLATGAHVAAIEPNAEMRLAAERDLAAEARFRSIDASAEATTLATGSVDVVIAAQAFHWFDSPRARAEFARILRRGGWVALVWNDRKDSPFNRDYEDMLERFAPAYAAVRARERAAHENMETFFAPEPPKRTTFANEQQLDELGLLGRLESSSYVPRPGQPGHDAVAARAREIYHAHQRDGGVTLAYETVVWYGRLSSQAVAHG